MKRFVKLSLSFVYLLLMNNLNGVYALDVTSDPIITFDGDTKTFTYDNAGSSVPDLYSNLKGLLPGDEILQEMRLEVVNLNANEEVNIYLQSMNENSDHETLSQLNGLVYTITIGNEEYEATLDNREFLGTFSNGDRVDIDVSLTIPLSIGNEIQNLDASIDWVFSAEILSDETTNIPNIPNTGDHHRTEVYIFSLFVCIVVMIALKRLKDE